MSLLNLFTHNTREDKGRQNDLQCCYHLCPSNQPFVGAYKPRMKFNQKVAPQTYQYKCLHCGCLVNVSVEMAEGGREVWRINPAFLGGRPSFNWEK